MFPCERCGSCCRRVGEAFLARQMAKPSGVCKYLDESSNLCTIYEDRPIFCRVDEFYEQNLSSIMPREDFYLMNKEVCKNFQRQRLEE